MIEIPARQSLSETHQCQQRGYLTGHLTLVWPSARSASEKINERPVAQANLIVCLLSGA